jgi:hypothetical protein
MRRRHCQPNRLPVCRASRGSLPCGKAMNDVSRLLAIYEALDEEVTGRQPPSLAEIETEIHDLVAEAWLYGVSAEQFTEDCHSHSLAFWQDWFAMDDAAERTGASPDEIAQAIYYRELARTDPEQHAPGADHAA